MSLEKKMEMPKYIDEFQHQIKEIQRKIRYATKSEETHKKNIKNEKNGLIDK